MRPGTTLQSIKDAHKLRIQNGRTNRRRGAEKLKGKTVRTVASL